MEPIRVTHVLGYFKEPWYIDWMLRELSQAFKDCPDIEKAKKFALSKIKKAADDGAEIGTNLDKAIKDDPFLTKFVKKMVPEEELCMLAYRKWLDVYKPKSIVPCTRLNATIEGVEVTGEPDLMVDGVLVDIKCARKISLKYWVQVMVYSFLSYGAHSLKTVGCKVGILRLDKTTGSYEYVVKDYDPKLVDVWLGMMEAMVYLKGDDDGNIDV